MRVIAGTARSLPLKAPEGLDVRPTTDRIKETLFNILQWDIAGGVFLDLCSGSGGIGIEALSRGAKRAYFVDSAQKAIDCIRKNLAFTKMEDRAVVLKQDVCGALGGIREEAIDIVFLDPPYDSGLERQAFGILRNMSYVTEDTILVVEAERYTDFSWAADLGFSVTKEKCYRTNKHVFMKREQL